MSGRGFRTTVRALKDENGKELKTEDEVVREECRRQLGSARKKMKISVP